MVFLFCTFIWELNFTVFTPSASFEFGLLSLFCLGVKIGCLLSFLFNVCIHSFTFHCWWCFCRIPYMLVCSVYILISLQVFSKSLFLNYFSACWLFKSVFNLHILVDFPTFPSTIDFSFHCIVTGKSSLVWFESI